MENDPSKNPFDSWLQQRCHPNAPAGGGGPGNFTNAGPLQYIGLGWESLPHPNSPAGRHLTHQEIRSPAFAERVQSVVKAYFQALRLAPAAVYQETGYQLGQIIDDLLPGILQMLAVLGISTVAGAGAGAAVGFFLGGVGAAPGAVVGGGLGLEAGTALLTWMGLGFLAVAIGQGMSELTGVLRSAIHHAWHAAEHHHPQFEINRAAQELARAVGILFRLILQGILAYVLKKGAASSSRAAVSTGQAIIQGGTRAAADETLAEVSALLRKSKLPDGFAVWIEKNWDDLKRNPQLVTKESVTFDKAASSSIASTPSELRATNKELAERTKTAEQGKETSPTRLPSEKTTTGDKLKTTESVMPLREQYLGRTPGKNSRTGKEVQERMWAEDTLREDPLTGRTEFQASDRQWYDMKYADMSHKTDAVTWWNETGRQYGERAPEVRKWMLDSNNYVLDHQSINRSLGAKLGQTQTYLPPLR